MTWEFTTIRREDGVATVTFDRRAALNAFNGPLVRELTEVARSFYDDHDTRAVVLTGTLRSFSAGADLKEARADGTFAELRARNQWGRQLCKAWEDMPQATVAAIEGMAVGAGVALAMSCDWRVMGEGAFLYVPEVKIGRILQWQAIPRLISLVGPARTKRIVILCEKLKARTAADWGLVDEVAPDGGALDAALELARAAAAMPGEPITMTKQAVNATANALLHATSFMDSDLSLLVRQFDSAKKAMADFAEGKR